MARISSSRTGKTYHGRYRAQSCTAGGILSYYEFATHRISAGDIPPDFPAAARATQVTDLARGLTMRAQLGMPRKTLLKDAEEAAELVLQPRRG
jgi:hypothetical protein